MKKYIKTSTDTEEFELDLHDEFLDIDDHIQDKLEEFREYWSVNMENNIVDSYEIYDTKAEIGPEEFDKITNTLQDIISYVKEFENYYNNLMEG